MAENVCWFKRTERGFKTGGRYANIHIRPIGIQGVRTSEVEGDIQINDFMSGLLSNKKDLSDNKLDYAKFQYFEQCAIKNVLVNLRITELQSNSTMMLVNDVPTLVQNEHSFVPIKIFIDAMYPDMEEYCFRFLEMENRIRVLEARQVQQQDLTPCFNEFKERFKDEIKAMDFDNPIQLFNQLEKAKIWLSAYTLLHTRVSQS